MEKLGGKWNASTLIIKKRKRQKHNSKMEWSRGHLKSSDVGFFLGLGKEVFSAGKPHLCCVTFCTEVLFNRYPPVKQLNGLPSDRPPPYSIPQWPGIIVDWRAEARGFMRGTLHLSLIIFRYLFRHLCTTGPFSEEQKQSQKNSQAAYCTSPRRRNNNKHHILTHFIPGEYKLTWVAISNYA